MTESDLIGLTCLWFLAYLLLLVFLRARSANHWRATAIAATVATFVAPLAVILYAALSCGHPGCGIVMIAALPYVLVVLPILGGIAFFVFDMRSDRWKRDD